MSVAETPGDAGEASQAPRHQVGSRPSRHPHLVGERLPKGGPAVLGKVGIAGVAHALPSAPADNFARSLVIENGGVVDDPACQLGGGGIAPVEAPGGVREVGEQKAAVVRTKHRVSPAMDTCGTYLTHASVSVVRMKRRLALIRLTCYR